MCVYIYTYIHMYIYMQYSADFRNFAISVLKNYKISLI